MVRLGGGSAKAHLERAEPLFDKTTLKEAIIVRKCFLLSGGGRKHDRHSFDSVEWINSRLIVTTNLDRAFSASRYCCDQLTSVNLLEWVLLLSPFCR